MPLLRYILSGLIISLAGCNTTTVNRTTSSPQSAADSATQPSLLQAKLAPLFIGTIQKKENAQATFTPCDSQQAFQLEADDTFWQQWRSMGSPRSFQASVSGQLAMGANRGDAFRLQVLQPSRMTPDQSLCQNSQNQSYQFKTGSDQPFWSLIIDNDQGALTTPDGVDSYRVTAVTTPAEQALQIALRSESGKNATLQISSSFCQENNQTGFSGYQTTLQLDDGQVFNGCGEQGQSLSQPKPAQTWVGRSELEKSDITLTLQPNFTAQMNYKRDIGPEVSYVGVWQSSKNDSIRVMFNKRMGLDTSETIPFSWQEKTLRAEYRELSAGKAYFMTPLVLTASDNATDNSTATTSPTATSNGAVMIAPPPAPDSAMSANSFAENETIITGASGATPSETSETSTSASATTNTTPMAGFSAGVLQSSVQPDIAIDSAVKQFLQNSNANISGTQYRYAKADLNGDGQLDAIVQLNWCDQSGCNWLVLQGNAGQYQQVGHLEGFSHAVMVSPTAHQGWYDLITPSSQTPGNMEVLMHDANAYPTRPVALDATPDETTLLQLEFSGDNWITLQ